MKKILLIIPLLIGVTALITLVEFLNYPDRWKLIKDFENISEAYTQLGIPSYHHWSSTPSEYRGVLHDSGAWWMENNLLSSHRLDFFHSSESALVTYRITISIKYAPFLPPLRIEEGQLHGGTHNKSVELTSEAAPPM